MDINGYVARIEAHVDNPDTLEQIREQVQADDRLDSADRDFLLGRIGTYLADSDRAGEPEGGWEPDAAPEERD